ncbi:MAG: radical SAM family heme chaperone HemW [Lentisphaerae bacterium]|nr:radical SAM family heme chaperone HemW [Lentisphaerota bacterium]
MSPPPKHIYVHIPFCSRKCGYCAFYSVPFTPETADGFMSALLAEMGMAFASPGPPVTTVYIGGGTPSILGPDRFRSLARGLRRSLDLSGLEEWTVEVNPGSLRRETLDAMLEAGVNRLSVGVQSFDDAVLSRIGRPHTASDAANTVAMVRSVKGLSTGLDLIAGLPGAGPRSWRDTLARAIALRPDHVSVYTLSVEPGTPLALRVAGGLENANPDRASRAMDAAARALTAAGYIHYETSNFARRGRECRHNLAVWRGEDYAGLGPAACSRLGRTRRAANPDIAAYIAAIGAGLPPPAEIETLPPDTDATERLMFAFRLREGVHLSAFAATHAPADAALLARWNTALGRLRKDGLVKFQGGLWYPTRRGRAMADSIAAEFVD